jgi:hypothetical protein
MPSEPDTLEPPEMLVALWARVMTEQIKRFASRKGGKMRTPGRNTLLTRLPYPELPLDVIDRETHI